jgi:curli biogenesis system outer membrane secretion channel CsgG
VTKRTDAPWFKGLGRLNVRKLIASLAAGAALIGSMSPAVAQTNMSSDGRTYKDGTTKGASSGRRAQERAQASIPVCTRKLGSVAIVEPDNQWWREFNLGSPEAILKIFVQRSGCFTIVNRGRSMASRNMERAMADSGELQAGSNLGRGQVKAADYFLQPDIVTANRNSGGGGAGAAIGALGGLFGGVGRALGGVAGGINVKKGEATVTLSVVNARTTEEMALTQGYARKTDVSFGGGAGYGWWGGFAAAGGAGYQDTAIGQTIVLAYLDAYTKFVTQLGGLPTNAAAAAPVAR